MFGGESVCMNVICVIIVVYVRGGKRVHERNLRNHRCLRSGGKRVHERNLRNQRCLRLG